MRPRRISMRDVAAESGVTAATVSRALRQDPRLSEETRARVHAAAGRLGYTLLPELSVLMGACRRQKVPEQRPKIALLSSLDSAAAWQSARRPNMRLLRDSALQRAAELGFATEEIWAGDFGFDPGKIAAHLRARGIRRVLVGPSLPPASPPSLDPREFSLVTVGATVFAGVAAVFNDHYLACITAVTECHRLGYRRPGLMLPARYNTRDQGRWEAGYLIGIDSIPGIDPVPVLPVSDWEDPAEFAGWYRDHRPDVVLAATLNAVTRYARQMDLRVPQDLGLVSLGVTSLGSADTGIFQDSAYIGQRAVDLLADLSAAPDEMNGANAINVAIAGRWNPGKTVRAGK